MRFLKRLQYFYRRSLKEISLIRNIVFFLKICWRYCSRYYCRYKKPTWRKEADRTPVNKCTFAVICDDLTWANISCEFETVFVTPKDWRCVFETVHPDIFFCESTWEGLDGSWENEIYHNQKFKIDNRFVLKDILRYCRRAGIPAVFWNKEDSPAFVDEPYSFIDTALLFDHIFTTAEECIPRYQALGHKSVHLMMFGFSPKLFYPLPPAKGPKTAVFLGSWYAQKEERCQDMCRMFDAVLSLGLKLEIYDRVSAKKIPDRQYPERYRQYIHDGVPYGQTREAMKNAQYVININSVKDSKTMFARRVFEAMACGRVVISNESPGLRALFPGRIWFMGEPFREEDMHSIISENIKTVYEKYTFRDQLLSALSAADLLTENK